MGDAAVVRLLIAGLWGAGRRSAGGDRITISRMSPVSRGRKAKKNKVSKSKKAVPLRPVPPLSRPSLATVGGQQDALDDQLRTASEIMMSIFDGRSGWYDSSSKTVLDQADVLMTAQGPRELEQATAELLGAEMYRLEHSEHWGGRPELWITEFVEATKARIQEEAGRSTTAWEAPLRLLHGLTSVCPRPVRMAAQDALRDVTYELRRAATWREQPEWLELLPRIAATGDVWDMRDVYGTRIAVIAGFSYPGGVDSSVFLFDIDVCGYIRLANAGVFDSVREAAAQWRAQVGDAANGVEPMPVTDANRLECLVQYEHNEAGFDGDETRAVMDNLFRAERRLRDLREALSERGMPLPPLRSLLHDIDTEPMESAFTEWYALRHGTEPDAEAVAALTEEWMEGRLPESWHAISPHRAEFMCALISDWYQDDPATIPARELLPEWVRWHGELSGLPEHLIAPVVAVAEGHPRAPESCAGQRLVPNAM